MDHETTDKSTLGGEVSREQQETAVRRAFGAAIEPMHPMVANSVPQSRPWIIDTYTNSVICEWAGKFYEVPFCVLAPRSLSPPGRLGRG
jgi:hypothetical protein